jgi:PAS domain S-box-containing protein
MDHPSAVKEDPSALPDAPHQAHQVRAMLWKIPLFYLLAGVVWIVFSDRLAQALLHDPALIAQVQTFKGAFYVAATAVLLYVLLRPLAKRLLGSQAQLRASEARYRQLFESNPSPLLLCDPDSLHIIDTNAAATRLLGWSRQELRSKTLDLLAVAEEADGVQGHVAGIHQQPDKVFVSLERLHTSSGVVREVELHASLVRYGGRDARLVIAMDRSAELEAQRARESALSRLQEAHRIARLCGWEIDLSSGHCHFSPQFQDLLGCGHLDERAHYRDVLVTADADSQARLDLLLAEAAAGAVHAIDLLVPLRHGGGERLVRLRAQLSRGTDMHLHLRGTAQDVTEEEQTRRLLCEREQQFRELMRILPDAVMILSGERVCFCNPACAAQFGYDDAALMGGSLTQLVAPDDLPHVRSLLRQPERPPAPQPVPRMQRRDGSRFSAALAVSQARYGGQDAVLVVMRDVSEPERIRDALATSNQELQAVARRLFTLQEEERRAISRDLHDDIGQSITAIKMSAHAALEEDSDAAQRLADLAEIICIADATLDKLRNLSTLLRPPQLDALGLEAALRGHAGMRLRNSAIALDLQIQALPRRPAPEIEQACFRIAQEALTNVLRHAAAHLVQLSLQHDAHAEELVLSVRDDGHGFNPQAARGLGLVMMRERAQTAGGRLAIESSHDGGTRILLHLPYTAQTAELA